MHHDAALYSHMSNLHKVLRYVTILDTFTMKRTTTMRKFHLNGSSYTLYTEKVIQIMIHFIKKNSIQVAQTLLFTINLTEHVLV